MESIKLRVTHVKALFRHGLAKPRVVRDSYLWTVVGGIRTVASFLRRVALQISRPLSSERMHRRRLSFPPSFDVRAIYRHNAETAGTHEPHRILMFRRWEITRTTVERQAVGT
ncbi:hypothetical protein AVEN_46778-1 [Araneus ventricosus]|uniref:Uncharacterized protein n=1 Tax=Araneus ventricosus TaxID=182803 RepID=A0A4Y2KWA9_ARAVE|nr:hypothetical protein AVEN_46778-1 [Araneus ventricosus]